MSIDREKLFRDVYEEITGLELAEYLHAWFPRAGVSSTLYGEKLQSKYGEWGNWSKWREKVWLYLDPYVSVVEDELDIHDYNTVAEAFIWKLCQLAGAFTALGLPEDSDEAEMSDTTRKLLSSVLFL